MLDFNQSVYHIRTGSPCTVEEYHACSGTWRIRYEHQGGTYRVWCDAEGRERKGGEVLFENRVK